MNSESSLVGHTFDRVPAPYPLVLIHQSFSLFTVNATALLFLAFDFFNRFPQIMENSTWRDGIRIWVLF